MAIRCGQNNPAGTSAAKIVPEIPKLGFPAPGPGYEGSIKTGTAPYHPCLETPCLALARIQSCFNENEDAHFSLVQKTPPGPQSVPLQPDAKCRCRVLQGLFGDRGDAAADTAAARSAHSQRLELIRADQRLLAGRTPL